MSALMTAVIMTALCGFVSLGVDLGRVQLAKTELQTAADAAVRAAANALSGGVSAAQQAAQGAAGENTCDGVAVSLTPATDLAFGSWNTSTRTFTQAASGQEASATALKVSLRRSSTNGIPLLFGAVLGKSTCNISATAIATVTSSGVASGLVGLTSVSLSGNAQTDSYNASAGPYSAGAAHSGGTVASNGGISLSGNSKVKGDALPGPGKSVSRSGNASVSGSTTGSANALSYPAPTLPGSYISGGNFSLSGNSSYTLSSGTYYYTGFSVSGNATLTVSGAVTIYVNGSLSLGGNFNVASNLPGNFKIRMLSNNNISLSGNGTLCADIYAPSSAISISGNGDFLGAAIGSSLSISGNGGVHYDESLGYGTSGGSGTKVISMVK
ncbi:MAG: pilus assembly protein TadG-related protein [Tepidisphaerales bacterium]